MLWFKRPVDTITIYLPCLNIRDENMPVMVCPVFLRIETHCSARVGSVHAIEEEQFD
jgi:hypothetical protein